MRRTKEAAAETKEKVLDAALKVFSHKGYSATTLEQVAKAARMTRGAVYWHFKNKAELFKELVKTKYANANRQLEAIFFSDRNALEKIEAYMLKYLDLLREDKDFKAIQLIVIFKIESVAELKKELQEKKKLNEGLVIALTSLMENAQKEGLIQKKLKPKTVAIGFISLLGGLTQQWLMNEELFDLQKEGKALIQFFICSLTQ